MGLAASQARLLSITSRMSDNELRSQLINNAKMRLTTDSAKVSDEYIAALNATQLMFSNFDTDGNEMYQALTFNSLTAYSAYNSQYGIANSSGELLVSATDAANFKTADGSLEKFLELYGLEQTTDYFDTLNTSLEWNTNGCGYYDNYGNWQKFSDITTEELQAMYEAEMDANGITHYGQADTINSIEYGDYQNLVEDYQAKQEKYETALSNAMKGYLQGDTSIGSNVFKVNGKEFDDYYSEALRYYDQVINNETITVDRQALIDAFDAFAGKVGINSSASGVALNTNPASDNKLLKDHYNSDYPDPSFNNSFCYILSENREIINATPGSVITTHSYEENGYLKAAKFDADGNFVGWYEGGTSGYLTDPGTGSTNYNGYGEADFVLTAPLSGGIPVTKMPIREDGYTYEVAYQYTDADGNIGYTFESDSNFEALQNQYTLTQCVGPVIYDSQYTVTDEDIAEALKYLYQSFRDSILNQMSSEPFEQDATVANAKNEYIEAAKKLANFIYGDDNGDAIVEEMITTYKDYNMIAYLDDPSWVLSENTTDNMVSQEVDTDGDGIPDKTITLPGNLDLTHFNPFHNQYPTTAANPDPYTSTLGGTSGRTYTVNYQTVKDLFLLDCLLEHYGEPTYTWIDQNDKDENGQAKATWYTNLFNRMQQGYKTLGEGLNNSQEWLQFAFESGLVHMEQVNKSSEWVSTMYSNCSNITESTVDVDITLAEAKYNREMAKIEAKDKQYDIELKNIDTEHESLKQEYESIKQVISKNIERNFKMFQNA